MKKEIIQATKANVWKSTNNTTEWLLSNSRLKDQQTFITFDMCDFYPSISENLSLNALDLVWRRLISCL